MSKIFIEEITSPSQSKDLFSSILENSTLIVLVYDLVEEKYIYDNDRFFQLTGYTRKYMEEIYQMEGVLGFGHWVHPDDLEMYIESVNQVIRSKNCITTLDSRYKIKGKEESVWVRKKTIPLKFDNDGRVSQILFIGANIDRQKKYEIALKEKEAFISNMLANTPYDLFIFDLHKLTYEYTNSYFNSRLEGGCKVVMEEIFNQCIHPDDQPGFKKIPQLFQQDESGDGVGFRYRMKSGKAGEYEWFWDILVPFETIEGEIVKVLGVSAKARFT